MARSIALNVHYNWAKDVFKNPKGHEHDLLSICCITKTMMGWNLMNVSNTCRERCGGMGFLSNMKFGDYQAIAHAAVTAEGDNRVLMTKIVKDYLTNLKLKKTKVPEPTLNAKTQIGTMMDVTPLDILADLLRFREQQYFVSLKAKMDSHAKQGKSSF